MLYRVAGILGRAQPAKFDSARDNLPNLRLNDG